MNVKKLERGMCVCERTRFSYSGGGSGWGRHIFIVRGRPKALLVQNVLIKLRDRRVDPRVGGPPFTEDALPSGKLGET
ncbi:hypothetical protein CEXT_241521 [Caerostris extrusa]|uniref:Uncharacterized protein n=1 Tax=Caerostris extrusa TaxID=172846 RepID=A0AAV4TQS5_CAEEX|nr:hypothetical protein CEXT_241521 [Caerostris extrusa]